MEVLTEEEIKKEILDEINQSIKVTKTFDDTGFDRYHTGKPVKLDDFTVEFNLIPENLKGFMNIGRFGVNNWKKQYPLEYEFRIKRVIEK